jgi:two-component system cell cycle response regulator
MSARIVIVDRAATGRIMLRAMLTRAGYDVTVCSDADEAQAALATRMADIVLADAQEVRTLAAAQPVMPPPEAARIIALARVEDSRARIAALTAGADDVLSRDAGEALILSTIRRLLRHRNAARASAIGPDPAETLGFAEAQEPFAGPRTIEDSSGPITVISVRPTALPRPIRMLIERHPGPVEVAATAANARGPTALYIVDGGGFPSAGDNADGLYRTVAELEVRAKAQRAATLVLVPDGAEHLGVMALDLGAEEQVAETVAVEELSHRVRRLLRRKAQEDRQRDRLQATIAAASIDPLTGLYNVRYADARLVAMAEATRDGGTPLALMMLDIDHFKVINDTHGHATGDLVLAEVARLLRENLRAVDLIARVGGEELLVAMPDTAVDQARAAAERLRRIIAATKFETIARARCKLRVTVSIGVAIDFGDALPQSGGPGGMIANLRRRADIALYSAKASGRNMVTVEPKTLDPMA